MALYLSRQVGRRIIAVLTALLALGLTLDMLENATDILEEDGVQELAVYALLRAPLILVTILPLGILVGVVLAFLGLSLRNEIVMVRIAGHNTLRIVLMLVPLALLCGAAQSYLVARVGPAAEQALVARFPEMFKARGIENEIWLRDWDGVIRIGRSTADGATLGDVSVFQIASGGELLQRIDAATAQFGPEGWLLEGVVLHPANEIRRAVQEMVWRTPLTPAGVLAAARSPELVDTAEVRQILAGTLPAGRGTPFYTVQLWRSYSAYTVPMVMFLFGVLASFRFSRDGGRGRYAWLGLLGGALFILTDGVFTSLGEVGALGAAWAAFLAPGLFFVIGIWSIMVIEE
jgi:LPS export ABC transporter permease LptG